MQPAVIVLVGSFISPENRELETFEQTKSHFDVILDILVSKNLDYLKDLTEWVFVPSLEDQGQI